MTFRVYNVPTATPGQVIEFDNDVGDGNRGRVKATVDVVDGMIVKGRFWTGSGAPTTPFTLQRSGDGSEGTVSIG